MDLLAMVRTLRRHKYLSLAVAALVAFGLVYVVALTPKQYQATTSLVLFPPPDPPSQQELAKDPSLANVNPVNPFNRFGDPSIIIQIVSQRVESPASRDRLVAMGADPRFTVAAAVRYGSTSPFLDIVSTGSTPAATLETGHLVQEAVEQQLRQVQLDQGVASHYLITPFVVQAGDQPQLQVSGKARSVIAVALIGVIVLFIMLSVANAIDSSRADRPVGRRRRDKRSASAGDGTDPLEAGGTAPAAMPDPLDRHADRTSWGAPEVHDAVAAAR